MAESKKKVVRKREKKKKGSELDAQIGLAVETGQVVMGFREGIKALLTKEPKVVIIAANAPHAMKEQAEHYVKLAGVPYLFYKEGSMKLGVACGRPHPVTLLVVLDEGSSHLSEVVKREGAH